jgi:subtilase family protein
MRIPGTIPALLPLLVALVAPSLVEAACDGPVQAAACLSPGPAGKAAVTPAQAKIASGLRDTAAVVRSRVSSGSTADLSRLSTELVRVDAAGEIQVYVIVAEASPQHVAQLAGLGLRIEITLPEHGLVQGWAPADALETIAALDFVKEIRPPGYPVRHTGAVLTAGDGALRADQARTNFGVSGAGVTVGVMSDGVDHLANSAASGDLPAGVQVLKNPGGDEGTAMLEIVHDLAPGAGLAFYGPTTSADMVNGINALGGAGARVVVDDLTFLDEPKFQDGMIAVAARNFATGGKVYVTSAGNSAQRHYRSPYRRTPGNATYPFFHDYDPAAAVDIGNSFTLPNNCGVRVVLQWNNPNGASADDFDLFLVRASDGVALAGGIGFQNGTQNAFEFLAFTNTTGGPLGVFVAIGEFTLVTNPAFLILDYFVYPTCGVALQFVTAADSVIGHAAVSEVLSVAAVDAATPTVAEPFSSRGPGSISFPAPQARLVPNISGTDCVNTQAGVLGFFNLPFCGTSASAPHVAAIAALLIERSPALTSDDLRSMLTSTAVDLGTAGFDFTFGFGRVDALNALTAAPGSDPYDHDGKADIAVFRSTGQWWVRRSADGATALVAWGLPALGDVPVVADYDGDLQPDIAVYRVPTGEWFILGSSAGIIGPITFGGAPALLDTPAPADFDGDGRADLAVYRGATGEWFVFGSSAGFGTLLFGSPAFLGLGDTPVPADYDGDNRADLAVYRRATGEWFVFGTTTGFRTLLFGAPAALGLGDTPVSADYDGDNKADLAVYRQATGEWFVFGTTTGFRTLLFGAPAATGLADTPVQGDYDGDGATDLAVYRGATSEWFIFGSSGGLIGPIPFGIPLADTRAPLR